MKSEIVTKTFREPDDRLNFHEHGSIEILKLPDGTAGMLATLKPGWRWMDDERPLLGNPESCPTAHTGYCLRGEIIIRMVETGKEHSIKRGDFFLIPPGHDAFVPGQETCELILFQGVEEQAKKSAA